ncbi:MAG: glycosyltransferase [Candidatus Rhabdochlamydia sp.]
MMCYKSIVIFLSFLWCFSLKAEELYPEKKTILVLCSYGGYGHQAAVQTLSHLIGDKYHIQTIYPIDEMTIFGIKSGEQFYNFMLQSGWIKPMNFITKHIAPKLFRSKRSAMTSLIKQHIVKVKPDLIISVIPFINLSASQAAHQMGVPYLLITVDNDLQTWVHGLQQVEHPHFHVTVSSADAKPRNMLKKRKIDHHLIQTTGLPIREEFFLPKDVSLIKQQMGILPHQPVILLTCGGVGGKQTLSYAEQISQIPLGAHLIVCAGKNEELKTAVQNLPLHPANARTVLGFTSQIADLMAISDVIITKSGPGTITEAMTLHRPLLIDATASVLSWEKANIDLVEHYKVGSVIHYLDELEPLLRKYLFDSEYRHEIQKAYHQVPLNHFQESIAPLIESMCLLKQDLSYTKTKS